MTDNPYIIRNFQLMKNIFDNTDILATYYKLTRKEISIIQELCMRHNSFKAYIEFDIKEYESSRKSFYRALSKLENENILVIVNKPRNKYSVLQVYFTIKFIRIICNEEFADLYEQWFNWRKDCISD